MTEPVPIRRRPFTLLDLTILVAGCALGFVPFRGPMRAAGAEDLPLAFGFAVVLGLALVGPAVLWCGRRALGHDPRWVGEWLWWAIWPIGAGAYASLQCFNLGLPGALCMGAGSAGTLGVSVLTFFRFLRAPRAPTPALARRARRRRTLVDWLCAANVTAWAIAFLKCFARRVNIYNGVWLIVCLAFLVVWALVAARVVRDSVEAGQRPSPWTDRVGLTLATLPTFFAITMPAL